jgi:hypothetical protein
MDQLESVWQICECLCRCRQGLFNRSVTTFMNFVWLSIPIKFPADEQKQESTRRSCHPADVGHSIGPEFVAITTGPAFIFPTAVFESQEPMITREAADLLNRVLSLGFGISGPFLGFSGLKPREGPSGWPFGVAVSVECPMYTTIAPFL